MNDLTPASASGNGSAKGASERRVRHGLIEDWRDGVGILILLLVAAFSGALIARYWPDGGESATSAAGDLAARLTSIEERLSQGKSTPEIAALKDRMTKLEARVRTAEVALAAGAIGGSLAAAGAGALTPSTGPNLGAGLAQLAPGADANRKIIDDMAARLTALEGKTATAPDDIKAAKDSIGELATKVDDLATRLVKIESSDLLALANRASVATAIANLTRAAQGSSPFKTEYDTVAALLPDDGTLIAIESYARQGLPTTGTLMAAFPEVSHKAIVAEQDAQAKDWLTALQVHFLSLISTRPVGEAAGNSTASRLARAEMRLKTGDLRAALKEVAAVTGPAHETLKPWINQAFARVKVESILADLNTRAVAALAGPKDAAGPVPQLPTP